MRDPHVVYLRYVVACEPDIDSRAAPVEIETDDFAIRLSADGQGVPGIVARTSVRPADAPADAEPAETFDTEAVVTMKRHYATIAAAQAAVEPILRAWAVEAALSGAQPFRFVASGDLVIDRDPPAGEPATYAVSGGGSFKVVKPARSTAIGEYPLPSGGFVLDEHAETTWSRWERYTEGRDTLTGAAYSILTYLEHRFASGRSDAAKQLRVSRNVLDSLGMLASSVGDAETARKFAPAQPTRRHTDEEVAWVETLIPELVRRIGRLAADGNAHSLSELTMADLPPLPLTSS